MGHLNRGTTFDSPAPRWVPKLVKYKDGEDSGENISNGTELELHQHGFRKGRFTVTSLTTLQRD